MYTPVSVIVNPVPRKINLRVVTPNAIRVVVRFTANYLCHAFINVHAVTAVISDDTILKQVRSAFAACTIVKVNGVFTMFKDAVLEDIVPTFQFDVLPVVG
jgi:hypothetical protein